MAGRSGQAATTADPPTEVSTKHANAAGTSSTTNPKAAPVERNVHWVDMHGYELAQVREFEPSTHSDDETEEDSNYEKKSCCIVC